MRRFVKSFGLGLVGLAAFFATSVARAEEQPILQLDPGGHMSLIRDIAFTPDGKYLVSGAGDKVIRIWDWRAGKTVRTIRGQIGDGSEGKVYTMALSNDGKWLASGGWMKIPGQGRGHVVRLYDFESGKIVALLKGHTDVVFRVRFSPDGKYLVSGSHDKTAILWDVATKQMVHQLKGHTEGIFGLGFTGGSRRVVTGSDDHTLRLWDTSTGKLIKEMKGHKDDVVAVAVSPVNGMIASGSWDKTIRLWDGRTGKFLRQLATQGTQLAQLSFTPDGRYLLSGAGQGPDDDCHVFEVATGKEIVTYKGHSNVVLASAVSPDGKWAATGGGDNQEIDVWELKTGKRQVRLSGVGGIIWSASFSADTRYLTWGKRFKRESPLGRGPAEYRLRLPGGDRGLGVPEKGVEGLTILGGVDKFGDYSVVRKKSDQYGRHGILEFSKDGKVVAKVTRKSFNGYRHRSFSFIPNGKVVVSGGANGKLASYDLKGTQLHDFVGHAADVWGVTPSADGRFVISGSHDQTVKLWNVNTGELIVTLFHGNDGEWVLWTPQGYYASSANGDKMIGWQINQGPDKAARFVSGDQLKQHFYRPEIVERAIALASARKAIEEVGASDFSLRDLVSRKPPEFNVLSPTSGSTLDGSPITVDIRIKANQDPIEGISITVNGRQVTGRNVRGLPQPKKTEHSRTLRIPISQGENRIKITAFNKVGQTVKELIINQLKKGTLDKTGTLYIVSIGVDKYPNLDGQDLSFAGADAKAFYETMRKQAGPLYAQVKGMLLYSGGEMEPSADNIRDSFDFFAEAGPEDTVVVFVAGHGVNEGSNYLFLPTDAQLKNDRFRSSSVIKWRDLHGSLQDARGRRIMMVDTCHSGGAFNSRLIKDAADANIVVFSATDASTLAQERSSLGHGVFTYALIEGLKGKADFIKDGVINMLELGTFVASEVRRITGPEQAPTFHLSGTPDFALAGL